uniref:EKA-like protein n=1 Tax=Ascaris lumbricoides TaxID=6252 RepID=A0A0M3ITJ5_ASCLU
MVNAQVCVKISFLAELPQSDGWTNDPLKDSCVPMNESSTPPVNIPKNNTYTSVAASLTEEMRLKLASGPSKLFTNSPTEKCQPDKALSNAKAGRGNEVVETTQADLTRQLAEAKPH